jgi:hypothetical protein
MMLKLVADSELEMFHQIGDDVIVVDQRVIDVK